MQDPLLQQNNAESNPRSDALFGVAHDDSPSDSGVEAYASCIAVWGYGCTNGVVMNNAFGTFPVLVFIPFFLLFLSPLYGEGHKVRVWASGGFDMVNEINGANSLFPAGGVALTYPVSDRDKLFSTELSVLTGYQFTPSDPWISALRFGFGIRVFFNAFQIIRPYFTHDIASQILWVKGYDGIAKTYTVLLGLGIDIPVFYEKLGKESSSLFMDVGYLFYDISFFAIQPKEVKSLVFSVGYSFFF